VIECYECGRDTILRGYLPRVTNTNSDTLFVNPCITECIKFMESGGLNLQGYRIEVIKYEG